LVLKPYCTWAVAGSPVLKARKAPLPAAVTTMLLIIGRGRMIVTVAWAVLLVGLGSKSRLPTPPVLVPAPVFNAVALNSMDTDCSAAIGPRLKTTTLPL